MHNTMTRGYMASGAIALAVILSGCGPGDAIMTIPPLRVQGKLLSPDGAPVANAKLHLTRYTFSEVDAKNAPQFLADHPTANSQSEADVITQNDGSFEATLEGGRTMYSVAVIAFIAIPPIPPRVPRPFVRIVDANGGDDEFLVAGSPRNGRVYWQSPASGGPGKYIEIDDDLTGLEIKRSKKLEEVLVTLVPATNLRTGP